MDNQQRNPRPHPKITLIPTHAADLPVSEQSEDGVIGAILRNPELYDSAAKIITSEDMFFFLRNSFIWRSMGELKSQSIAIDDLTLNEHISKKYPDIYVTIEPFHFTLLADSAPLNNIESYAEFVKETYIRRATIHAAENLKSMALDETQPAVSMEGEINNIQSIYSGLATHRIEHISVAANRHMSMVEENVRTRGAGTILTGLVEVDDMIGGLQNRKTTLIGGIAHHGKTTMLLEIALNAAEKGWNVGYMNVADGDDVDIMNRLATMISGVSSKKLILGTVTPAEHDRYVDAMGYASELPIFLKSEKGMSPGEIARECKLLKTPNGRPVTPDIIINDYVQRMIIKSTQYKDPRQEMMAISSQLTKLGDAKHFDCPVVSGAQLNMMARNQTRPGGYNVQESKNFYQDCDVFMTTYRDVLINPLTEQPDEIEIIIDKNKQTGEVGTVVCYFDKPSVRICDANHHKVKLGNTR